MPPKISDSTMTNRLLVFFSVEIARPFKTSLVHEYTYLKLGVRGFSGCNHEKLIYVEVTSTTFKYCTPESKKFLKEFLRFKHFIRIS